MRGCSRAVLLGLGLLATAACHSFTAGEAPDGGDATAGADAGSVRFVQSVGNHFPLQSATPATPIEVDVQFPFNDGGDLLIVSVFWDTGSSGPVIVSDEAGNGYNSLVGPTNWNGTSSEQLFYARNVADRAATTNTVTVRVSAVESILPPFLEVRAFEYGGVARDISVDTISSNASTTGAIETGSIATSVPMEFVFGMAQWAQGNCPLGSPLDLDAASTPSFAARTVSGGGGILAADGVIASPSSSVHIGFSMDCMPGYWVTQIAAFR